MLVGFLLLQNIHYSSGYGWANVPFGHSTRHHESGRHLGKGIWPPGSPTHRTGCHPSPSLVEFASSALPVVGIRVCRSTAQSAGYHIQEQAFCLSIPDWSKRRSREDWVNCSAKGLTTTGLQGCLNRGFRKEWLCATEGGMRCELWHLIGYTNLNKPHDYLILCNTELDDHAIGTLRAASLCRDPAAFLDWALWKGSNWRWDSSSPFITKWEGDDCGFCCASSPTCAQSNCAWSRSHWPPCHHYTVEFGRSAKCLLLYTDRLLSTGEDRAFVGPWRWLGNGPSFAPRGTGSALLDTQILGNLVYGKRHVTKTFCLHDLTSKVNLLKLKYCKLFSQQKLQLIKRWSVKQDFIFSTRYV